MCININDPDLVLVMVKGRTGMYCPYQVVWTSFLNCGSTLAPSNFYYLLAKVTLLSPYPVS